ncbi:MAG TPA: mechanosensitive ion channel domain-containing protein [Gemmatimonadales bacterium]
MFEFDASAVLQQLTDLGTAWGLKLVAALVVLIAGRTVARWTRRAVGAALRRTHMDETLVPFLSSVTYYGMLMFVLIAVLGMVGIQTASMIAVLGAAGLAVGFALQGTLANFAAGVMLLIFRPFRNEDFIEAGGTSGTVKAIGIFTTHLDTPDNVGVIIPNAAIWGQTIKNFATNPTRRIDLLIGISYRDDIQTAIETIHRTLAAESRVLAHPAPVIAVHELGESSVNIAVRPWCAGEDYWVVRWDLTRAIKQALEGAGCSIPFPQRDVHLFQDTAAA